MSGSTRNIVLENLLTPFNAVNALVTGGLLYVYTVTGDQRLVLDSLGVMASSFANTLLAIIQELRAHSMLERVRITMRVPVRKVTDGFDVQCTSEDLIPGDRVLIQRGEVVPVDGIVVSCRSCELDTSILTGESLPVTITPGQRVHGGSMCISGRAEIEVTADVSGSLAGQIESFAHRLDLSPSPLQRRINRLFVGSFLIALSISVVDIIASHDSIVSQPDRVRTLATLVLGLIPEGLVFFSTISFLLGIVRIRKQGIIVQRLSALESFASATMVCLDKTGTLTEDIMTFHCMVPFVGSNPSEVSDLLQTWVWSSPDRNPVLDALRAAIPRTDDRAVAQNIEFTSDRKYSALSFKDTSGALILGQPEVVLTKEHPEWDSFQRILVEEHHSTARVLVFVRSRSISEPVGIETVPLCVLVFHNHVREDAHGAVVALHDLGMHTIMLTGDRIETAEYITSDMGFTQQEFPIHARCSPDDKLQIVKRLMQDGHHVVMIGDGINDIPAMKQADVSVAPQQGTVSTKLVADIVMESSTLTGIQPIVNEGRATVLATVSIAKFFFLKNTLLVFMLAMGALGLSPLILTPRRGALLSIIGIAIPSAFIALWRPPLRVVPSFFKELSTYVAVHTIGTGIAFLVLHTLFMVHPKHDSIVLYGMCANLLTNAVLVERAVSWKHIVCSVLILNLLFLLIVIPTTMPVLSVIQMFYEVGNQGFGITPQLVISAIVGIAMSVISSRWVLLRYCTKSA